MTKREQILLTAVVILFALVGYVYAYQYLSNRTTAAENTNNTLLMQQAEANTKIAAISGLQDSIAATEADIATARENLSDFIEDEDLHRLFVTMAEDEGMDCTTLAIFSNDSLYQTGDDGQSFEAKEVSMTLIGDYTDFVDLIDTASARNNTVVASFSQDGESGTDEYGKIYDATFEVTFVVYMATEADAVA